MSEEASAKQVAQGSYIAQADRGGTAIVNVYESVTSRPADPGTLTEAKQRLGTLPLETIPDPAPLPPGSRMLLSRNPLFVGREDDVRALAAVLKAGDITTIGQVEIAAATGLGGIGKTQLASEFVHRYGQYFAGGVFWLSFADPNAVPAEVGSCGGPGRLDLRPDFSSLSLNDQVRLVLSAWQSPMPRLLVFDNCEDEALLAQWRPPSGGCRVLVTSRRATWDASLGVRALALGMLSREESITLLRKHRPDLLEGDTNLDAIAEELGDLPLALHLAGSYLARYRRAISPADYLEQLRNPALLRHRSLQGEGISPTGHAQHVGRTFALSYDRLDLDNATDILAFALLIRAAHFAPGEPIPYDLLVLTLDLDRSGPAAALQAEDAVTRLVELGLLESATDNALRLHRLLATFARDLAGDEMDAAQEAVETAMIEEAERLNQAGFPAPLLAWQPHLRAVTEVAQAREDERAARLCNALGHHLWIIGDYDGAWPYWERALEIRRKVLGEQHLDTAESLNNLGAFLLHVRRDLVGARPYLEQALEIRQTALGEEHPDTADILNNLGYLLFFQGNLAGARLYLERALAIWQETLGEEHRRTATSLENLGYLLRGQGDLAGARPYLERALAIFEKIVGEDHPDTAQSLNSLGTLLKDQGDLAGARPYLERALAIRQKALGEEHPDTAQSLNSLGILLREQGDLARARQYLERALTIRQKALGEEHPDTAQSLNDLGTVLRDQGNLAGAQKAYEQALAIFEEVLGADHSNTRAVRDNLAALDTLPNS